MSYCLNSIGQWRESLNQWRPIMEAWHILRNINGMAAAMKSVNCPN